jgi:leader peptidase (prepilin peptidase)/N-methyltransferase
MSHETYISTISFVFGMMVGSFANVVIYRLPLSLSLVSPRSHCGQCKTPISWYENIPLISFLFLRARCGHCGISIGWIHPIIEVITGFFALACVLRFGVSVQGAYFFVLLTSLLVASMIDLEHRIIPDSISLGGMIISFFLAALMQWANKVWHVSMYDSFMGLVIGGGFLWFIAWGYEKLTGREGMGFGDVKLVALFGAAAGWQAAIFSIFIASLLGSVIGLFLIFVQKKHRRTAIPFGPYLCIAFFIVLLHMLNIIHIPLQWSNGLGF